MVRALFTACLIILIGLAHEESAGAEDIARLQAGVVRITAKPSEGSQRVGTGFIVRLETDVAYIVTAAHVVASDPRPQVGFFSRSNVSVSAEVLPGVEGGDDVRGLALLVVKGKENLPSGIGALPLASTSPVVEDMVMIGFPLGAGPWHVTRGNIGSRQGRTIYFDPRVDSGNSGGPIVQKGKVVGMVMAATSSGQGITARSVQDYIEGFGITARESTSVASAAAEPSTPPSATAKPEPRQPTKDREITGKDGAPMALIPVRTAYGRTKSADLKEPKEQLEREMALERYSIIMNRALKLPSTLTLAAGECGKSDASYDRKTKTVTICYELIRFLRNQALSTFGKDLHKAESVVDGALGFIVFHELSHGFIDLLDLRFTGSEEDVADQIAVTIVFDSDPELREKVTNGALWLLDSFSHDKSLEGSRDKQRFYNIMCWAYGKDSVRYALLKDSLLQVGRAHKCNDEYKKMVEGIKALLQSYVDFSALRG